MGESGRKHRLLFPLALMSLSQQSAYYDPTQYDDPKDEMPVAGADNGLSLADFNGKAYNDPQWDALLDQLTNRDSATLVKAMRQAAKNIFFTTANSGAYTRSTADAGCE